MKHHGAWLRKLTQDEEFFETVSGPEPLSAQVADADKALIAFSLKLTREPASIGPEDIDELRRHGFNDRAIHDAVQVISYFAYVNRVADGLGVELEERFGETD
ncbi:MAG TPA: peroxidase [Acidobacteriota bacterium]|nr:peroxidase [Acidobacteriota bacterium]